MKTIAVALFLTASSAHAAPSLRVADGLEVKLWAQSPQLFNPTSIDVDARGRLWVTEAVNYRVEIRKSQPGDGYLRHAKGDRVVILEDSDGDGLADKSKVFVEDPELVAPLGIAVVGHRVIVSSSPSVVVYTDTDGDDRADRKEVFLTGFGGKDHDHGVHSLVLGPDGALYFNVGNKGPHDVRDRSGWRLRSTRDGAGPAGLKSDDGRVWVQGLAMRVGRDGSGLKVLAHNFRNPYELAVDAFGHVWQTDNDDDGNASCRLTYVLDGGNYGYTSADGTRSWRADQRAGQSIVTAHWHQEDPGSVPPLQITGSGSPAGMTIYEGSLLPARYRGMILGADPGRGVVFGFVPSPAGASYSVDRIDFLARAGEGEEAHRFRPSDVAVGPDGAVYVADWYDATVGGHAMRDKEGAGRIYRIAPPGARPAMPAGTASVDLLFSPAANVRQLGWEALAALGAKALPALAPKAKDSDPRVRARAIFAQATLGLQGRAEARKGLRDADENVRLAAFRALRGHERQLLPLLRVLVKDRSAAVRREVAVALRDQKGPAAVHLLAQLAAVYDGQDRMLLEAIGIGAEGKEDFLYARLTGRREHQDPLKWSAPMRDLAWRLHPHNALGALRTRAAAAELPLAERQRALVALAFTSSRAAADAVVTFAEKGDEPLRAYARDLVMDRGRALRELGFAARIEALRGAGAGGQDDARLEGYKRALVDRELSKDARIEAVRALVSSPAGGRYLIGLAAQAKLPSDVMEATAERIFRNPDVGVRALASQYFKRPAFEGAAFPAVPELMRMKGDVARGREVFFGDRSACAQCHEYGGRGKSVGPALTDIAGKMGREALFDSILNPSAGIAFGYEAWVITTKDQQTFSGFIVADGDPVLLKEISGETRAIPAKQIVHRQQEKTSIMPDNIALGMTPQQLVDLVTFLSTR